MNCPNCHRPMNEGNSPNAEECTETHDEEGLCEAYAKIHELRAALRECAEVLEELDLQNVLQGRPVPRMITKAIANARKII